MDQKELAELKLKCIELAIQSTIPNVLETAKSFYEWVVQSPLMNEEKCN
jgi:hypothetical protein